jgi:hypothetical protein
VTPDDDSLSDFWRDVRHAGQVKRASNRAQSPEFLREAGVEFEVKNGGAHLIVKGPAGLIDFWPGTGLWIVRGAIWRGAAWRGYGVFKLIKYCRAST